MEFIIGFFGLLLFLVICSALFVLAIYIIALLVGKIIMFIEDKFVD